jgi:sentrin-specific protease 1
MIDKPRPNRKRGHRLTYLPVDKKAEIEAILKNKQAVVELDKEVVNHSDLERLAHPSGQLNDNIVNFYGKLIVKCVEDYPNQGGSFGDEPLKVHYFSTFFWEKLKDGYEGTLAKWTKHV